MHSVFYVNDSQHLRECCEKWSKYAFIALDTEFVREKTFYPIAGLIQVGVGQQAYLLDPLAIDDWQPFAELLSNHNVIKVLHSCSEDLEVLQQLVGVLPEPLYDTQIAMAFAGLGFSWSYAKLVAYFLNIEVAKEETRSDWLQRPLTEQQQLYAAQDVLYLEQLFPALDQLLSDKKRAWLLQDCADLVAAYRNPAPLTELWMGAKQAWRLNARQSAALRELYVWREEKARSRNLPRNRIIKEVVLFNLAQKMPQRMAQLEHVEDMPEHAIRRDGRELLECVQRARELPDEQLPARMPAPLSSADTVLLKRLRAVLQRVADEQNVAVEIVLKKKILESLLRTKSASGYQLPEVLQGWRRELLGEQLLNCLK